MMKWNIFLLLVSLFMLAQEVGYENFGYLNQAEVIAKELAPQIGVDKYILWDKIEDILEKLRSQYKVFCWVPWAIFSFIITVKLVFDVVKQKRRPGDCGAVEKVPYSR
jgi:hypothetical protein